MKLNLRLFIITFCAILGYTILYLLSNYALGPDGPDYLESAKAIKTLELLKVQNFKPLGYPIMIAVFSLINSNVYILGSVVSIIATALLVFPVFYLAKEIFSEKIAYLSVVLTMLYPWVSRYSFQVMSEATYLMILTSAIYLAWKTLNNGRLRDYFITSCVFGFAYLTRNEAILHGLLWFSLVIITSFIRGERNKKLIFFRIILSLCGLICLVFPYMFYLYVKTGQWLISPHVVNIAIDVVPDKSLTIVRNDFANICGVLFYNFKAIVFKYFRNIKQVFCISLPKVLYIYLVPFAIWAVIKRNYIKHKDNGYIFLFVFFLTPILALPLVDILSRYFISTVPIFIILVSAGLENISKRWRKKFICSTIVILLILTLRPTYIHLFPILPIYESEYKETGLWIRDNLPENAKLLTTVRVLDYYAQREYILVRKPGRWIPNESLNLKEILIIASDINQPCYLIIQERWKSKELEILLNEENKHPYLKPVYVNDSYNGAKVIVYYVEK